MQMFERLIRSYDGDMLDPFHMPSVINISDTVQFPSSLPIVRGICLGQWPQKSGGPLLMEGGTRG
jgi:hypothetical protein